MGSFIANFGVYLNKRQVHTQYGDSIQFNQRQLRNAILKIPNQTGAQWHRKVTEEAVRVLAQAMDVVCKLPSHMLVNKDLQLDTLYDSAVTSLEERVCHPKYQLLTRLSCLSNKLDIQNILAKEKQWLFREYKLHKQVMMPSSRTISQQQSNLDRVRCESSSFRSESQVFQNTQSQLQNLQHTINVSLSSPIMPIKKSMSIDEEKTSIVEHKKRNHLIKKGVETFKSYADNIKKNTALKNTEKHQKLTQCMMDMKKSLRPLIGEEKLRSILDISAYSNFEKTLLYIYTRQQSEIFQQYLLFRQRVLHHSTPVDQKDALLFNADRQKPLFNEYMINNTVYFHRRQLEQGVYKYLKSIVDERNTVNPDMIVLNSQYRLNDSEHGQLMQAGTQSQYANQINMVEQTRLHQLNDEFMIHQMLYQYHKSIVVPINSFVNCPDQKKVSVCLQKMRSLNTNIWGTLSLNQRLVLLDQLETKLQTLHHVYHVAHRDIKPDNLFVNDQCNDVVFNDFGFSTHINEQKKVVGRDINSTCGTPLFISPMLFEFSSQKNESENKVTRSLEQLFQDDYWALGVTIWCLETMNYPFSWNQLKTLSARQLISVIQQTQLTSNPILERAVACFERSIQDIKNDGVILDETESIVGILKI